MSGLFKNCSSLISKDDLISFSIDSANSIKALFMDCFSLRYLELTPLNALHLNDIS